MDSKDVRAPLTKIILSRFTFHPLYSKLTRSALGVGTFEKALGNMSWHWRFRQHRHMKNQQIVKIVIFEIEERVLTRS
jgi:hypothetical protein